MLYQLTTVTLPVLLINAICLLYRALTTTIDLSSRTINSPPSISLAKLSTHHHPSAFANYYLPPQTLNSPLQWRSQPSSSAPLSCSTAPPTLLPPPPLLDLLPKSRILDINLDVIAFEICD